ncbi:hypothetical protein KCU93_g357, partial [Aureobasidium melanogenum]
MLTLRISRNVALFHNGTFDVEKKDVACGFWHAASLVELPKAICIACLDVIGMSAVHSTVGQTKFESTHYVWRTSTGARNSDMSLSFAMSRKDFSCKHPTRITAKLFK